MTKAKSKFAAEDTVVDDAANAAAVDENVGDDVVDENVGDDASEAAVDTEPKKRSEAGAKISAAQMGKPKHPISVEANGIYFRQLTQALVHFGFDKVKDWGGVKKEINVQNEAGEYVGTAIRTNVEGVEVEFKRVATIEPIAGVDSDESADTVEEQAAA